MHTLTEGKYCQKIKFWLRNNSDKSGLSNEVSAAANEHSPVTVRPNGQFREPGEARRGV